MEKHFFKFLFFSFMLTALPGRMNGAVQQSVSTAACQKEPGLKRLERVQFGELKDLKYHQWHRPKKGKGFLGALVWVLFGAVAFGFFYLIFWLISLLVAETAIAFLIAAVLFMLIYFLIITVGYRNGKARRKRNTAPKK